MSTPPEVARKSEVDRKGQPYYRRSVRTARPPACPRRPVGAGRLPGRGWRVQFLMGNKKPSSFFIGGRGQYLLNMPIVVPPPFTPRRGSQPVLSSFLHRVISGGMNRCTVTGASRSQLLCHSKTIRCLAQGCHWEGSAAILAACALLSKRQMVSQYVPIIACIYDPLAFRNYTFVFF
jgi:hypothetical protein